MHRCQEQSNKMFGWKTKIRPSKAFNQPANLTNNQAQVPWVRLINPIYLVIRVSQSEGVLISELTNERRGEAQDTHWHKSVTRLSKPQTPVQSGSLSFCVGSLSILGIVGAVYLLFLICNLMLAVHFIHDLVPI